MSNHCYESRLKFAFSTSSQHLQRLLESGSCSSSVGHVSLKVRISRISEQCDCVEVGKKLMQQLHTLWSRNTDITGHTGEVTAGSTEPFDQHNLDRVGAAHKDNGDRFGRRLCSKCGWDIVRQNHRHFAGH